VAKLLGGGLHNSSVVRGMVLKNDAVGSIKRVEKAKVSSKGYSSFTLHTGCTFESSTPFFFIYFEVFLMKWSSSSKYYFHKVMSIFLLGAQG
jgi:hypothetical protein